MFYLWIAVVGLIISVTILFILLKTVLNFTIRKLKVIDNTHENIIRQDSKEESEEKFIEKFPIKIGDKIIFVNKCNVSYLEAKDNYVFIHDLEGNEYITDYTLKSIENKTKKDFIRIHRSHIVNRTAIKEIHKYFNGKYAFILRDKKNSKILSSLSYSERVRELFKI